MISDDSRYKYAGRPGLGERPCTGPGLRTTSDVSSFSIQANDILKVMALNLVISTPQ